MNITGLLPPVYNIMLTGLTGSLPVTEFVAKYSRSGGHVDEFAARWGNRQLVEMTPHILMKDKLWAQPVDPSRVSYEMLFAFNDPELQNVIHTINPKYRLNPGKITLRDAALMANVQYAGFLVNLARRKSISLEHHIAKLNDPAVYQTVMNGIERICPDMVSFLPDKQPLLHTKIPGSKDINSAANKVKRIERIITKSNEYQPEDNIGEQSGILRVQDLSRYMLVMDNNRATTLDDVQKTRNYLFACVATGQLGFDLTRFKDPLHCFVHKDDKPDLPWPGIILNGKQTVSIDTKSNAPPLQISMRAIEVMLAVLNPANVHFKELTVPVRDLRRREELDGQSYGGKEAQEGTIEDMYLRTLPTLCHDMRTQKAAWQARPTDDPRLSSDPAHDIIQNHMAQADQNRNAKKPPGGVKRIFDISEENSLTNILKDKTLGKVFEGAVQPIPGQKKRPTLIH